MIFQSLDFLCFLLVVLVVYWRLPQRGQNLFLLAASYFFYGYVHAWYLILIATTTCVDYCCARWIHEGKGSRKIPLIVSLVSNFSILATFKYFNFFADNIIAAFKLIGFELHPIAWQVLLPVGISFYTFQSASYVIDVYLKRVDARKGLSDYALFVSFFPQLVAGPIERASDLLAQVESERRFDFVKARSGIMLIVWGVFKKLVIADTMAGYANRAFSLEETTFPVLWAGALAFSIQIYADFSAYTDIARGSARLLGFELRMNFNHPWLARNPSDFWRRWHTSLSTWFRDYVYIPLGGSRGKFTFVARNIMITFLLSGLWHGASWNFILWGAWHGVLLVLWHGLDQRFPRYTRSENRFVAVQQWLVMSILSMAGWLLFREQNLAYLTQGLCHSPFAASKEEWMIGLYYCAIGLIYSLPLWIHALWANLKGLNARWAENEGGWGVTVIQSVVVLILAVLTMFLRSETTADFIYFQF